MSLLAYFLNSALAVCILVYYAYFVHRQFYPTILFLVSSKASFVVCGNMFLVMCLSITKLLKNIFFGRLRDHELEVVTDRAKYIITETCIALTIFRSELTLPIFALFGLLVAFKLWHRLAKARLEYLEQINPIPNLEKSRMIFLLASLIVLNSFGGLYSLNFIVENGKSVLILFCFEFGLMFLYSVNLSLRFLLLWLDTTMTNGLQSRNMLTMVVDIGCELLKFLTYISFFCLIYVYYGVAIHIIRGLWSAYVSFSRKIVSFTKYLQLTRNLDRQFDDATEEELLAAGNCLVCREGMDKGKKVQCGHVFHVDCLRMWLQHQQTCPLCRFVMNFFS
jgi:E3 ubiquitin-protein ligase synoviolin